MQEWVRISSVDECPPGEALEVLAGDRVLGLYNVDGDFFALDGICPHQGGPLPNGRVDGYLVTCPWHGWQFDVRSGQHAINPELRHQCFPVKVEGRDVYVLVDTDD